MYMCIYIHIYICIYIYPCICLCVYIYIYIQPETELLTHPIAFLSFVVGRAQSASKSRLDTSLGRKIRARSTSRPMPACRAPQGAEDTVPHAGAASRVLDLGGRERVKG